jgi:hypothetical protein
MKGTCKGLTNRNGVSKTVHHSAFKSFQKDLLRMVLLSNNPVSVRAIGFTTMRTRFIKIFPGKGEAAQLT